MTYLIYYRHTYGVLPMEICGQMLHYGIVPHKLNAICFLSARRVTAPLLSHVAA